MKATKKGTSWGPKRAARLAAGLAVLAITAVGIGAASNGASAANGWRVSVPPTTTQAPVTTVVTNPTMDRANGW
jgi:hypothetical protein